MKEKLNSLKNFSIEKKDLKHVKGGGPMEWTTCIVKTGTPQGEIDDTVLDWANPGEDDQ
jgi:hypothetical protein